VESVDNSGWCVFSSTMDEVPENNQHMLR
jgi:hypothetical protein